MRGGIQHFVCKKGFGWFVPMEAVVREKDFDAGNIKEAIEKNVSEEWDDIQEYVCKDELLATPKNCDGKTSGKIPLERPYLVLVAFIMGGLLLTCYR